MRQLTCGGLIIANTGPLGHFSSSDVGLSLMTRWKNAWLKGVAGTIATDTTHERWW